MSQFLESVELWLPGVMVMSALVLASGFFSASETALFSLSRDEVRRFRMGKSRERIVSSLLRNPDRLLTAVLFWNLLVNLSYFAVSVVVSQRLVNADQGVAAGTFGILGLLMMIVGGEVVPKSIAVVFPYGLAMLFALPLAFAVRLIDPISPGLNQVTRLARRTFWPHLRKEPYLDADDLERAVEVSNLEQEVVEHERQILHNILDMSEIRVEEVMRPRGSYLVVDGEFRLRDAGHEAPPGDCVLIAEPGTEVIERSIPLVQVAHLAEGDIAGKSEPVVCVPWTASLAFTLQLMIRKFNHVAVVVNEYGETMGIATYDDIMDTVISPESSRARRVLKREPVLEVAPSRYHVEGMTTLRYLSRRLNLDYEPDSDGLLTVAGMMHDELEHIPTVGDVCRWQGYVFKVIEVKRRGHLRAVVFPDPVPPPQPEEGTV